jgi:VWFA-related protein
MIRSCRFLLLLSLALPTYATPQTPAIPHLGETVEISIVNVDAVVVDKQGRRVQGLHRDDFDIYENGVRQPITNFAEYASAREEQRAITGSAGAEAPVAAPQPPPLRSIIVFVERFQLPSFSGDPIFGRIKTLLHDSVRPGDRVMVASWNNGVFVLQQSFTDDSSKIDKAIDTLAEVTKTASHNSMDNFLTELDAVARFEAAGAAFGAREVASLGTAGRNAVEDSGLSFFAEQDARMFAKIAMFDERRKVQTLNALMRSAGALDGKKVLLLATHRLSMYSGAEAFYGAGATSLPAAVRDEFDARPMMRTLIDTANANGFTIYPVYPEGLGTLSMPSSESGEQHVSGSALDNLILLNETPMLEYVAAETGGMTAWGGKDVTNLLPRIGDDFDSYYSLAYRAMPGKASSLKVDVRVKDPSLTVRSRRGFVPKTETTRMEDRVIGTLFGNAPPSSFAINVTTGAAKHAGKSKAYLIPISVEIPIAALTALPGPGNVHNGAFSVFVAWGSTVGGVSETHHDTKAYSIAPADLARSKTGHYTYTFSVESLIPSPHIALGVYDEVSRDYSVRMVDVQAPAERR